jgi:RNA-directed DNA polymerase
MISSLALSGEDEARRVGAVLDKRMERFGLTLPPDKTRLLPFRRPPKSQQKGKGPATFDLLGFTFYWARSPKGHWWMACKTRRVSLRRAKTAIYDWCRATGIGRLRRSTPHSIGACEATATTSV